VGRGTGKQGFSGLKIKSGIVGAAGIMPLAEEIGLVPNFVINTVDLTVNRVVAG